MTVSTLPIAWNAAASRIGDERRVRRSRQAREDLLVEPAEVEDRLPLRHPERPCVVRLEALQAGRAEERLEQEPDQRDPGGRGQQVERRQRAAVSEALGRRPAEQQAGGACRPQCRDQVATIAQPPNGTPTTSSCVQSVAERRHADEVADACEPEHVGPTAGGAQRPEEREAEEGEPGVERDEAEDRAKRHAPRRRIDEPFLVLPHRLGAGVLGPVAPEAQDPGRVALSRRGRRKERMNVAIASGVESALQPSCGSPTATRNVSSAGIRPRASMAMAWSGSTELPPPTQRSR